MYSPRTTLAIRYLLLLPTTAYASASTWFLVAGAQCGCPIPSSATSRQVTWSSGSRASRSDSWRLAVKVSFQMHPLLRSLLRPLFVTTLF